MIGKWGFSLLSFYLGIIPIFANNNYTLTHCRQKQLIRLAEFGIIFMVYLVIGYI